MPETAGTRPFDDEQVAAALGEVQHLQHATAVAAAAPSPAPPPPQDPAAAAAAHAADLFGSGEAVFGPALRGEVALRRLLLRYQRAVSMHAWQLLIQCPVLSIPTVPPSAGRLLHETDAPVSVQPA